MRILAAKDLRNRFNNAPLESEIKRRVGISKNSRKPKSKEHSEKIRNAKKGSKNPMFGIIGDKKSRSKSIKQYDLDGTFIKEWGSMNLAEKELGFKQRSLWATLKTKKKEKGGFIWK